MCKLPSKVFCIVIKSTLSQAKPCSSTIVHTLLLLSHCREGRRASINIPDYAPSPSLPYPCPLKQEIVTITYVSISDRYSSIEIQTCTLKIKHTKLVRSINILDCAPIPSLPYTCPLETRKLWQRQKSFGRSILGAV